MSRKLTEQIPSESRLVDAALKENLKTIFERLERPLCLKAVLEPDQRECTEMGAFLKAVAELSPMLELQLLEKGEDPQADRSWTQRICRLRDCTRKGSTWARPSAECREERRSIRLFPLF